MSKIMILAETGIGKSSSLRNLNPAETAIINSDRKELPLKGWRKNYVNVKDSTGHTDFSKSNYIEVDSPSHVLACLNAWEKEPRIKTIVLDTITHMITQDYMANAIGKDFKSYQLMGKHYYQVMEFVRASTKNIIIMGHIKKKLNETGDVVWEMYTQGNMISNLVPASYFTTVLVGEVQRDGADKKPKYVFRTQSNGNDPAKSPAVFEDDDATTALELYEPNDAQAILMKLEEFETK